MDNFTEELINETIGKSSRKWALVVFALVVGALGALVLNRRAQRRALATKQADHPVTDDVGPAVEGPVGRTLPGWSAWTGWTDRVNRPKSWRGFFQADADGESEAVPEP